MPLEHADRLLRTQRFLPRVTEQTVELGDLFGPVEELLVERELMVDDVRLIQILRKPHDREGTLQPLVRSAMRLHADLNIRQRRDFGMCTN
jgi:hypothetical protein